MFKSACVAALCVVTSTNAYFTSALDEKFEFMNRSENDAATPAPGAIQTFFDVEQVGAFLNIMATFAPQYSIKGKTFDIKKEISAGGIDFKVNNVTLNDLVIRGTKVDFLNNTDVMHITMPSIMIDLGVDANATSDIPLPNLEFEKVILQDVALNIDLSNVA